MQTSAASLVGTHGGLGAMSEGHAETRPLTPRTPHSARERAYVASKDGGKGGVGSRMSVGSSELLCEDVIVGGCHVDAALLESGLSLQSRDGGCARFFFSRARPVHVFIPAAELIAARLGDGPESSCHALIYHLSTPASDPNAWSCGFVTLVCSSPDAAQRWVDEVSALCSRQPDRPRTVQVYVNPHGGRRTAPMIWERKCKPILELASVRFRVLITKAANHAKVCSRRMPSRAFRHVSALFP